LFANSTAVSSLFAMIRTFTEQWPQWVGAGFSPDKNAAPTH
jgi:hypothetical protein